MNYRVGSSGFSGNWNTTAHGAARWMTPEEAADLEFFDYQPGSIVLGQNTQGELSFFNRQGHVLVLAPPRSGKGIGFVQPNLIAYQGSMVVTDPKGENAAVSAEFRRRAFGHNVVVLDPTQKLASYPGEKIATHRFNPLTVFDHGDYEQLVDDIGQVADALLVPKEGEREPHWRDGARQFLVAILTYLVFFVPREERTIIRLARLANGLDVPLDDLFLALTHNGHPHPAMQDVIARTGGWWDKINLRERASFISVALRSLAWLNSPVWREHLSHTDFHPYDLKAGKTTVFIVCPFEKLEQYAPWFRLVLSCCIVAVLRAPNRSAIPTLFMLDEYAATIGRLAMLEQAIPYIEGMGGRFAMIFQTLAQMQELWPEPAYHGIFASAGAHVFSNASDQKTSEYISNYIGKYSAMAPGPGGMSFVARDLLTPDEVRTMAPADQIAFIRGYRPAWLGKIDVRSHPALAGRLLDNPLYALRTTSAPALSRASGGTLLSASAALNRAKEQTHLEVTTNGVAAAIAAKYPGKKLRFEGEFYGYDELWLNPATGLRETIFTPVLNTSILDALAGA
jgi:type IV secretion system protein VirD4